MRRMRMASRRWLALLALLALASCESATMSAPESTSAQATRSFEQLEMSVVAAAGESGIDLESLPAEVPLMRSGGHGLGWVYIAGSVGDEAVEAVIGSRGGLLNLGPHWLLVPRDAVRSNTLFRMEPIGDGTFHVDLTATSVDRRGRLAAENNVGGTGFRKPVYLAFHSGGAPFEVESLQVAWLTNGTLITQPTFVYDEAWAVGVLRHFSGYVLVGN